MEVEGVYYWSFFGVESWAGGFAHLLGLAVLANALTSRGLNRELLWEEVKNGLRLFVGEIHLGGIDAASFDSLRCAYSIGFKLHWLANEELPGIKLAPLGQWCRLYPPLCSMLLVLFYFAADGSIFLHANFLQRMINVKHSCSIGCDLRDHVLQLPSILFE